MEQKKVIIFSHENDIDGIGCVILGMLTYGVVHYDLASNVYLLETKMREYLEQGKLNEYDYIYITDLALYDPALTMIGEDSSLSKKVFVFDHHVTSLNDGCNKYDFVTIKEKNEAGLKTCGTELFYQYLCSIGLLSKSPILDDFVELTRLEDTWEWKKSGKKGVKAHDLAILFNAVGIDDYIGSMFVKLSSTSTQIELTKKEQEIVASKKAEYLLALQQVWSEAEFLEDEWKNKYAGVFADYEMRNELAEYVRSLPDCGLKYIVLIALEKGAFGQKSYRSIASGFDVASITVAHGGGGHKEAASVNITKEQKERCLSLRKTNKRESIQYIVDSCYHA